MILRKFLNKLFFSSPKKNIKTVSVQERRSFLYEQIYKYMFVKKILINKLYFVNLAKENKIPVMFEDNINEESIKKELMTLLEEGYQALSNIYLSENQKKAIDELTQEEATNVIQWIEQFFIEGFIKLEEYEKCSLLQKFSDRIKEIKQININSNN